MPFKKLREKKVDDQVTIRLEDVSINKSSPVPLYHQLAESLEQIIAGGMVSSGKRLMNEVDLARALMISRPTVRQAIDVLVRKGILTRRRGVGTVVARDAFSRKKILSSLYDDLYESGQNPSTKVLKNVVDFATPGVAKKLQTDIGCSYRYMERIRLTNGRPLALLRNWLPSYLPELTKNQLEEKGLYSLIKERGLQPRYAEQRISAIESNVEYAEILKVKVGEPLISMRHTAYDTDGRVFEYGEHIYLPKLYTVDVTVYYE